MGTRRDVGAFKLGPGGDIEYIRVPDGAGGFVTLPVGRAPVFGDSGASVSVDNNTTVNNVDNSADLEVEVNMQTGEVVRFERRPDDVAQAIFGTLGALLLVLVPRAAGPSVPALREGGVSVARAAGPSRVGVVTVGYLALFAAWAWCGPSTGSSPT